MIEKLISKINLTPAPIEFEYSVGLKKLIKIITRFWESFIDVPLLEDAENKLINLKTYVLLAEV